MTKKLTDKQFEWYLDAIDALGAAAVKVDRVAKTVTYDSQITSDESHVRFADPEELAHAVTIGLLNNKKYQYPLTSLSHELHFAHGSKGSKSDEVDILIRDSDGLPYALFELKAASEYDSDRQDAIKNQLFGTAPLVGTPKLLIYSTVDPKGTEPQIKCICIDYTKFKSYSAWVDAGEPHSTEVPQEYRDIDYKPYVSGGANELTLNSTQADFRAVATAFHNEFFGEHADNTIFVNLVKCLLAKIHDERTCKKNDAYEFQVKYKSGKPETAQAVFSRINELYRAAYKRYIDPAAQEIDEINPKEFAEERVKTVVLALQSISITKGAARHGDIIGAFFEEILRSGFKQDRGMYFTHDNLVRFMIEAVNIGELTKAVWAKSTHPENRLPYIMDPACGSGTFLLHAMGEVTRTIKQDVKSLVVDHDSEQFYNARMSDAQPNYWAENFIYGFDPKFIMAITAKVNMVLHGDGSAHIIKDDAFRSLSAYSDTRLRPCSEASRSVPRAIYDRDVCEAFDAIISNPPFGITISSDIRAKLAATFLLPEAIPSEGLFLERCYQLLKPGGRLAIVLPESILNAKDLADVRLFLYRFFDIRCVVSLPRNIFIDTPTLTSLVFAQKKRGPEVIKWDAEWQAANAGAETRIQLASQALRKANLSGKSAATIASEFLTALSPVATVNDWVLKGGKAGSVLRFGRGWGSEPGEVAADHFKEILRTASFQGLKTKYVFSEVAASLDLEFPAYEVAEVGYKLSKRKERSKPNQLMRLRGKSGSHHSNIHLTDEEFSVDVDTTNPRTVLDHIRKHVVWS